MSSDIDEINNLLNIGNNFYKTFGLFIIIISTIGNLCNCFVFICIPALNKHPNALFIIGSSIGSLLYINIGLFSIVIRLLTGIDTVNQWLFWCKTAAWLTYSGGCFSFMCNCFTALGQFLITSSKQRWQRLITRIRAKLMIIFTGFIWLLILLPLPIFYNLIKITSTTYSCQSSRPIINLYAAYWIIIGYYFLPIILIFILFFLTSYNLKQLLRRRRALDGAVTRMMLIQMSILLFSGIPAGFFLIYALITQYYTKTPLRLAYESVILIFLTLLTYFTNGISFWVYLFASKTFRKHLKGFISGFKLFKNRTRPVFTTTIRTNAPQ